MALFIIPHGEYPKNLTVEQAGGENLLSRKDLKKTSSKKSKNQVEEVRNMSNIDCFYLL